MKSTLLEEWGNVLPEQHNEHLLQEDDTERPEVRNTLL